MQDYSAGDLVLPGGNLPHCWKKAEEDTGESVSIVVHFRKEFAGDRLFDIPDSGFNDVSNFHRTFRSKTNISPLQYRNTFRKKL
jgi:hypothetical protein